VGNIHFSPNVAHTRGTKIKLFAYYMDKFQRKQIFQELKRNNKDHKQKSGAFARTKSKENFYKD
jgi:hypothetical protein